VIIILAASIFISSGDYWSSCVCTNSSCWCLDRESSNITFDSSSSVEGKISPVAYRGRKLNPYHSYYAELKANDIRLRERTAALEGSYKSKENISMKAATENEINIGVYKPFGSNIYTITYNETWPAYMRATRTMEYFGRQINDRDFEGNNGDYVGANLLYNQELFKDRRSIMWIDRMNATVLATDDFIVEARFQPTKYLGYRVTTHTTGLADFRYKFSDERYNVKLRNYPARSEGDERYYGTYDLIRRIEMKTVYDRNNGTGEWLPCDFAGWADILPYDRIGHSADEVFNCFCNSREDQALEPVTHRASSLSQFLKSGF
jgi:hypothetical protein